MLKVIGTMLFLYQQKFSMEHHELVSNNALPHSKACFCFWLGTKWEARRIHIGIWP